MFQSVDGTKPVSPSISIIVEWENVVLAGDEMAKVMLDSLAEESRSMENVGEVRFVFDPAVVDVEAFQTLVRSSLAGRKYHNLKASLFAPVTGAGVILAYSTLQCAGLVIALAAPGIARKSWKI